ncbi:MAG: tetracycline resistance MFS efflux pump [Raineya sp.]
MKSRSVLFVLFITIFIDLLGFGIIIPILPTYARTLQASSLEIGLLAASYSLMNFVFAPFWGSLSDRFGRKPIILVSVCITGLAYVAFAYADELWLLFVSRIIAGVGSANISAAQAYIADVTPPQDRAKNFGIIGAAFGLGLILGPPLGGFVKAHYGIEHIGWLVVLLCSINLIVGFFLLTESITEKNRHSRVELNPIKDIRLALRRNVVREVMLLSFGFIVAFMMIQTTLALLWSEQVGFDDKENGYAFSFMGLVTAITQGLFVGKLNKKFGEQKLVFYGSVLLLISGLCFPIFASKFLFIPFELLAILLAGLASACFTPALNAMLSQAVSMQEQGRVLGINQSFGAVARTLGPAMGGFVYDYHYFLPYWGAALLMILVCYWAATIPRIFRKKATI